VHHGHGCQVDNRLRLAPWCELGECHGSRQADGDAGRIGKSCLYLGPAVPTPRA
jgi:hypothetical protein